jgi:hypothetical protein
LRCRTCPSLTSRPSNGPTGWSPTIPHGAATSSRLGAVTHRFCHAAVAAGNGMTITTWSDSGGVNKVRRDTVGPMHGEGCPMPDSVPQFRVRVYPFNLNDGEKGAAGTDGWLALFRLCFALWCVCVWGGGPSPRGRCCPVLLGSLAIARRLTPPPGLPEIPPTCPGPPAARAGWGPGRRGAGE